jgi:hypothetical protein
MKKLLFFFSAVLVLGFSTREANNLSKKERKFAADYFKQTRDAFLKDVQGLSESQLNFKTSPERWSVAQCIDHIAIAENAIFAGVQKSLQDSANPSKRAEITAYDTTVLRVVTDRSHKSTAPEFLQPDGKFANTEEAMKSFIDRRNKTIDYILHTHDDLRNHFGKHAIMGTIDDYQGLLVISAHCRRHTLQIEEVMADANFPKK